MNYMTNCVERERSVRQPDGSTRVVRIAPRTLMTLRWDLRKVAVHKAVPPMTAQERAILEQQLQSHGAYLETAYQLKNPTRKQAILGKLELKLMIESLLDEPNSWDVATQSVLLHLVFFHTGCREGSILVTKTYKSFLKWKDSKVEPIYVPGMEEDGEENDMVLYGFTVTITLDTFKGYQYLKSLEVE